MKDMIAMAEKGGDNKKLLAIKNADKTAMAEVAKVLSAIDLKSKHSWAISNSDMNVARDLGLSNIKKYWRYVGQIEDKVDWLHKDSIPTFERLLSTHKECTIIKK